MEGAFDRESFDTESFDEDAFDFGDDEPGDTTPAAFTFVDRTGAPLSTVFESNIVTLTGFDSTCDISITDGEYSKNGGAYTSAAGTADPGDTIRVRGTSSGSFATAVNVVFTADVTSDTFTITTVADPGSFTTVGGRRRDGRNRGFMNRMMGGRG